MGRLLFGALVLVIAVSCGGRDLYTSNISQLAQQLEEATRSVKTYRFSGDFELGTQTEQGGSETVVVGKISFEAEFATPNMIHIYPTLVAQTLGEAEGPLDFPEILYDGESVFVKRPETAGWVDESGPTMAAILQAVPSLGEIVGWVYRLTNVTSLPDETMDGVTTLHLKGTLPKNIADRPLTVQHWGNLEVWIGETDHLMRRASYERTTVQSFPDFMGPGSTTLRWNADLYFYDYDSPITIEVPGSK